MSHPSLNDIIAALIWVVSGAGSYFLSKYAYKSCKSNTPFEQRARRVIPWYWALFSTWQACVVLNLPGMHSLWIKLGVTLLIIVSLPAIMLVLFLQDRAKVNVL